MTIRLVPYHMKTKWNPCCKGIFFDAPTNAKVKGLRRDDETHVLLFRSVWEFGPYAQVPCRTHTVGPHAYGLANFTLLTHSPYGPVRKRMVHINEPQHEKKQLTCAPSEDSDQPGYPPSLISRPEARYGLPPPPPGEFCRPWFSWSLMSCEFFFATC